MKGSGSQTSTTTSAPPSTVAPYLQDAAKAATDRYNAGSYIAPIQQSGIDYGQHVLNGDFLNANPYLDQTFKNASGAVTNAVQSNFALAGRNPGGVDAAANAQYGTAGAGGGYDDLAAKIYGGNYQAERQRQQDVLGQSGQLGALSDPSRALDDYLARLNQVQGNSGVTTSQIPLQSNWLSGGLGLAGLLGGIFGG